MKKGAFVGKKVPLLGRVIAMVKVDLPKGTGGLTGHHHTSPSHDRAAHTGGWRRPLLRKRRYLPRVGLKGATSVDIAFIRGQRLG